MEILKNKKHMRKIQEVEQKSGDMEQLGSYAGELAVENFNPVIEFGCMGVFPEEIWLHVLDKLSYSKDILSVLEAFPELDKAFQSKKAYWLFDQVLPHLMTKHLVLKMNYTHRDRVKTRELLKLRLISKRWNITVKMAVENYADRNPIGYASINGTQFTLTPASFGLPMNHFKYQRIKKYHLGATVFRTLDQITDFHHEMANFQSNPFPGKYVDFELDSRRVPDNKYQEFVKKAMTLLQKFGDHVLVLVLDIRNGSECFLEMCKAILEGLSTVPNLQSLKICGCLDGVYEATHEYFTLAESQILFPKLENLESYDWQVDTSMLGRCSWVDHMVNLYGGHTRGGKQCELRKLVLDHKYWNAQMASNLGNLTELHLGLYEEKEYDVFDIRNVLILFSKGQLKKFCLRDYPFVKEDREIYIDELIGMLGEFEIENVVFEMLDLKERVSDKDAVGFTSLHLDDSIGLSYEFLRRLPNLRFLNVHVPFECVLEFTSSSDREYDVNVDEDSFTFKVRQYFWCNDDPGFEWKLDASFNIWDECGKLEQITASVVYGHEVFHVQFVRNYENKPFFWLE